MSSIDSRPQTLPMDNARKLCCFLRHAKTWVLIYWIRSKIKRHNIVWVSWNFTIDQFRTVTLTEYVTIKNNMARKQVIAWKFPRINDTWCLRVMMQSGTNILCCWLELNISSQLYFYDMDIISVRRKILLPINLIVIQFLGFPRGHLAPMHEQQVCELCHFGGTHGQDSMKFGVDGYRVEASVRKGGVSHTGTGRDAILRL